MEKVLEEIQKLSTEFAEIKKKLYESENARHFENWITRKALMEFFDYGETQMATLLKNKELVVSEIGKRKFIKKESILKFLEQSIKK